MNSKLMIKSAVFGFGLSLGSFANAEIDIPIFEPGCFSRCYTAEMVCMGNATTPGQMDACAEESFRCMSDCR
ncbi:hypothetical protein [Thalassomonas sp. RHCl1]|uniref:hypothetical protein n=1 Tax=Thalassomonas sp. RHCl1 TaxID=2995320 RepID=UPI00248AD380|nr:hypothetical protein [Thalassomonas sp. RHCl1]